MILKILNHHQLFLLKRMIGINIIQFHQRSMISTDKVKRKLFDYSHVSAPVVVDLNSC